MSGLFQLWRVSAAPARPNRTGNLQGSHAPAPDSKGRLLRSRHTVPTRCKRTRRTGLAKRESDSVLFSSQSLTRNQQLWTSRALPVDGLTVRLRRFRKSHHLILASRDPNKTPGHQGTAVGSRVNACWPAVRVSSSYPKSAKVETACPCSKALLIPGTTRSRWSRTSPPITTGRLN